MNRFARVASVVIAAALAATNARAQLSCNGSLTCSSSTPAYSFTNNGTGNALNLTAGTGKGLNVSIGAGIGVYSVSTGGGTGGYFSSSLGYGAQIYSASTSFPALEAEGYYNHGILAEAGGNTGSLFHAVKAVQKAITGTGGYGVYGESSRNTGVYGKALTAGQYGVYASGNLGASGTKSFVEPHPYDASKEIRYAALEGPEAGTYFRGTARISKGTARIIVPEDFRIVSDERGLTVHVTPIGELAIVACVRKDLHEIVIQGTRDVEFDYIVHGIRKAFVDFTPITNNTDFIPESPSDVQFAAGLPEESVRRLKANGTLNEDGTVNLFTAQRQGWDKLESWNPEPRNSSE